MGPYGIEAADQLHIVRGSLYEHWLSQFLIYQIGEVFKISFTEYIDQSRAKISVMNRLAEQHAEQIRKLANGITDGKK